jgi:para-nitrobenzyl esterase
MRRLFAACAVALIAFAGQAWAAPVKVDGGLVEGKIEDGLTVYRGLPFAAPPVGALRWKPPAPAAKWNGVRDASNFSAPCIGGGQGASEDCLYLNVWTPAQSPTEKLPVMVWIYGGGFAGGATNNPMQSGEELAKKGVVFVSIAYRVGPMGFLAHPELSKESRRKVSGNYGLLDQVAALQWIQRNIAAFGGDPKKVTIFGESAGGIAVSMLAASPLGKGLFRGAMSQSGGSFGPTADPSIPGENVQTLARAEGEGKALAEKLGAKDIAALRALTSAQISEAARGNMSLAWPILDGWVIPDDQYKLYEARRYNDTPILIGLNSDEGISFGSATNLQAYQAYVRGRYGPHAEALLAAYPANDDASGKQAARDLMRDSAFGWHNWVWARLQNRTGKGKVFYYIFEQRPPYPPGHRMADAKGVPHAAEIPFVFKHLAKADLPWRPEDHALSEQTATYWTNFVKTLDPNGAGLPAWPAFTEAQPYVMHLKANPSSGPVPNPAQLEALDAYFAWRRGGGPAGVGGGSPTGRN